MFVKKIDQVETWLLALDLMRREAVILDYGLETRYIDMDDRIEQADMYGPLALGVSITRVCWAVLTHQQKREQIITKQERSLFGPSMSLARFYHTMAVDKPRLLLLMGQLKDRSYKPLLKLWEERHTQPKGVYTGKT